MTWNISDNSTAVSSISTALAGQAREHPKQMNVDLSTLLRKCAFCDSFFRMGTEIEDHMASMHPDESANLRRRLM